MRRGIERGEDVVHSVLWQPHSEPFAGVQQTVVTVRLFLFFNDLFSHLSVPRQEAFAVRANEIADIAFFQPERFAAVGTDHLDQIVFFLFCNLGDRGFAFSRLLSALLGFLGLILEVEDLLLVVDNLDLVLLDVRCRLHLGLGLRRHQRQPHAGPGGVSGCIVG